MDADLERGSGASRGNFGWMPTTVDAYRAVEERPFQGRVAGHTIWPLGPVAPLISD
jgi:hypothetical protein